MRSLLIAVAVLSLALAGVAQAGDVYRYVTDDGIVSFTDEAKMVPAKYKESAETLTLGSLKDFNRLTVSTASYEALTERLEQLREINAAVVAAPVEAAPMFVPPYHLTQEMRWVPGVLGSPGDRYVSVDVLYDSRDREIAWALSEVGLKGSIYIEVTP